MARYVALLRAVNVGGRRMPMAELRGLAEEIGLADPKTFIQSGNLLFEALGTESMLEAKLEKALAERFGFHSDVVVRSAAEWRRLVRSNPFEAESKREPNRVLVGLPKSKLAEGAAKAIAARAAAGERVHEAGGGLWFHFPAGVGTSKITPAVIDRAAGSPVTTRNWRTLLALQEMLEQ